MPPATAFLVLVYQGINVSGKNLEAVKVYRLVQNIKAPLLFTEELLYSYMILLLILLIAPVSFGADIP
jgi:hypothetical protein